MTQTQQTIAWLVVSESVFANLACAGAPLLWAAGIGVALAAASLAYVWVPLPGRDVFGRFKGKGKERA